MADIQTTIETAIQDALTEHEAGNNMVLRWVSVVEIMDAGSGERGVWAMHSPDMVDWEVRGLLKEGKRVHEDPDDD